MMLWPRAAVLCIVLLATSQVSSAHAVAMTARDAATANPYNLGPLKTKTVDIAKGQNGSPLPAVAVFPEDTSKDYPLYIFQHGFMNQASWLTDLFAHVASHGFVVVGPQMYSLPLVPSFDTELDRAVQFAEWCGTSLESTLNITTNTSRTIISGHSRGGKVAFSLMNNKNPAGNTTFIGVAGVDPVDGGGPMSNQSAMITSKNFTFTDPALVIGLMVGTNSSRSCNPEGRNSVQFYGACTGPTLWAQLPDAGHGDILNPGPAFAAGLLCPKGNANTTTVMETVGGLLVSFGQQVMADLPLKPPAEQPPMKVTFQEKNVAEPESS